MDESVSTSQPDRMNATVVEVLPGYGIAHAATESGFMLGVRRDMLGVAFDELKPGDVLVVDVLQPFSRVLCVHSIRRPAAPAA